MKKNDLYGNQEIEKILKEKMNALSSSVDCFDKISARAFPEKNPDFSDCELTVTDLENVTGKRRHFPILKWVSAAAAVVICVGVLPKTALMNNLRNSIVKKSDKKSYSEIVCEIKKETADDDYMMYDIPLDYYSKNDVLITPAFSCPFENSGDENTRVRIFIRVCGGVFTNQLYAVEYSGEYAENNFIAVAESNAKFTEEELKELESSSYMMNLINYDCVEDAMYAFDTDSEGNLIDKNGNIVSAASFGVVSYFKDDENRINSVTSSILYYHIGIDENVSEYFYDINAAYIDGTEIKKFDIPENSWKESVYSNGVSAFPDEDENNGGFTRTQLFLSEEEKYNSGSIELYYMNPAVGYQVNAESETDEKTTEIITVYLTDDEATDVYDEIASVAGPYNLLLRNNMAVYIPYERISNSNNNVLAMQSSINNEIINFVSIDEIDDENGGYQWKTVTQNYEETLYSVKENIEALQKNVIDSENKIKSEMLTTEETDKLENSIDKQNRQIEILENYQKALEAQIEAEAALEEENRRQNAEEDMRKLMEEAQSSTAYAAAYE